VCCSVLQCVAVRCLSWSTLHCRFVCSNRVFQCLRHWMVDVFTLHMLYSELQCVVVCAVRYSVLQCVAVRCSLNTLQFTGRKKSPSCRGVNGKRWYGIFVVCRSVLQYVAVCHSVLQCVAVCCSVLQCVVAYYSVLQCVAVCCRVAREGFKDNRNIS